MAARQKAGRSSPLANRPEYHGPWAPDPLRFALSVHPPHGGAIGAAAGAVARFHETAVAGGICLDGSACARENQQRSRPVPAHRIEITRSKTRERNAVPLPTRDVGRQAAYSDTADVGAPTDHDRRVHENSAEDGKSPRAPP